MLLKYSNESLFMFNNSNLTMKPVKVEILRNIKNLTTCTFLSFLLCIKQIIINTSSTYAFQIQSFIRLWFIIDYLSKATLIGFMAGAAVIVSMQQLKGLLGIVHFSGKTQIIPVLSSVLHERREVSHKATRYVIEFKTLMSEVY